ncbi:MAG: hypothetical protein II747_02060, partial [Clostridia bacterium]|nr:hypothetical protein [Clostridia bacterium]
ETVNANKTYICYNYTSVLDKLLVEKHVVHVHGTLTNDPIVGIDNDTQFLHGLNFVPSSRLKRAFIKPRLNEACDTRRMIEAIKAIVDADVICIYGLSLGNSDLTWKETITEWLHSSSEHHLFVYDYYWMIKPHRTAAERFEHEDEARLNLFRKLNINENEYNALTRQIHMPCGKKIFEIKEIIERYHEKEQTQLAKAREQEESNRKSSTGRLI